MEKRKNLMLKWNVLKKTKNIKFNFQINNQLNKQVGKYMAFKMQMLKTILIRIPNVDMGEADSQSTIAVNFLGKGKLV